MCAVGTAQIAVYRAPFWPALLAHLIPSESITITQQMREFSQVCVGSRSNARPALSRIFSESRKASILLN
jgi:hypothetical protein